MLLVAGLSAASLLALTSGAWRGGGQSWLASFPATLFPDQVGGSTADGQTVAEFLGSLSEALPMRKRKGPPASESDVYNRTHRLLPDRFLDYETKQFIVISDAAPGWSRQQAHLLDRTHHQFNRFTKRLGIRPRPLRHKLVCVLFQEHRDYRRFAEANDGVTAQWISGYYSPKHDRIVFYNIETNPDFAEALRVSETAQRMTRAGEGHAPAGRSRLRDEYKKAATATVVHEAVHQLAFHTRIQSPQIQNPLWLSEGLATSFETDRPNMSFGPDYEYDLREEQFTELLEDGKLIALRDLVTYSHMPDNQDDTIAAVYHQSYALVRWMSRFRRSELRRFMNDLRSEVPGRPTPRRHLELFEKTFGDVDRLERAWLRYERKK